mgnify:CR=1 FL=1
MSEWVSEWVTIWRLYPLFALGSNHRQVSVITWALRKKCGVASIIAITATGVPAAATTATFFRSGHFNFRADNRLNRRLLSQWNWGWWWWCARERERERMIYLMSEWVSEQLRLTEWLTDWQSLASYWCGLKWRKAQEEEEIRADSSVQFSSVSHSMMATFLLSILAGHHTDHPFLVYLLFLFSLI